MQGHVLLPLNELRDHWPEAYAREAKKYQGRETLMEKRVPVLGCLWNDVIHTSPVNPQIILDTFRQEGLYEFAKPAAEIEVYKIPIELIDEDKAIYFQCFAEEFGDFSDDSRKYWSFSKAEFAEQMSVEPKQIEMWKKSRAEGRRLLWFTHTRHVLVRQRIDVSQCEVITCR